MEVCPMWWQAGPEWVVVIREPKPLVETKDWKLFFVCFLFFIQGLGQSATEAVSALFANYFFWCYPLGTGQKHKSKAFR